MTLTKVQKLSVLLLALGLNGTLYAADHGAAHDPVPLISPEPLIDLSKEVEQINGDEPPVEAAKPTEKTVHHAVVHWSYAGEGAPNYWGELDPKFFACKEGKNQSPIDLRDAKALETKGMEVLELHYGQTPLDVVNNGHTIQVNFPVGNSYLKIGRHRFELLQFHFHSPSEHEMEGFLYPLEMHLVHKDGDGNLAVIGLIFKEGRPNAFLQTFWNHLPQKPGESKRLATVTVATSLVFPKNLEFYRYSGSLTTPPCSEGVRWMVFKQPLEVSYEQVKAFHDLFGDNNRPVQPHNARSVLKSWYNTEPLPSVMPALDLPLY